MAFWFVVVLIARVSCSSLPSFAGENPVLVIRSQDIAAYNEAIEGFKDECKKANVPIGTVLDLKGNVEAGERLIKGIKLKYSAPRLILSVGVLAATLVKEHFPYTPSIFCMVVSHERFALSDDNVSGISSEAAIEEQFLAYKDFFEGIRNIGVVFDPMGSEEGIVLEAEQVAHRMGFNIIKAEAAFPNTAATALKNIIDKIDALWIIPNHAIMEKDALGAILEIMDKRRLPTFSNSIAIVKAGALFAISPEYRMIGLQAAKIAQTLLSLPSTTSLGVQRPEKFRLTVNSKTAKKLGINVSRFQGRPDVVLYP